MDSTTDSEAFSLSRRLSVFLTSALTGISAVGCMVTLISGLTSGAFFTSAGLTAGFSTVAVFLESSEAIAVPASWTNSI